MKFLDDLKDKMDSRKSKINAQMQTVNELNQEIETLKSEIAVKETEYMDTLDINLLQVIEELKKKVSFIEKNKGDRLRLLEGAKQKTYDINWNVVESDIDKAVKASKAPDIMVKIKNTQAEYYKLLGELGEAVEQIYEGYSELVQNQKYMDVKLQAKIASKYGKVESDNGHFKVEPINSLKEKELMDQVRYNIRFSKSDFNDFSKSLAEFSDLTGIRSSELLEKIPMEHREQCELRLRGYINQLSDYLPNDPQRIKLQEKIGKLQVLLSK